MSEANVAITLRAIEAWQQGDTPALRALAHPEIEVHIPENPDSQLWHGPDGAQAAIDAWSGAFDDYSFEVEEVEAAGDRVLILARQRGRGPVSGVEMEQLSPNLFTIRDGLLLRWEVLTDLEEARAALRTEPGR